MKSKRILRYTASLAFLSVASLVFAQDQSNKPAAADDNEAVATEPMSDASLGVQWWILNGNWQSLERYASPPSGLYIKNLSILSTSDPSTPYIRLALRGVPDSDFVTDGVVDLDGGKGVVRFKTARANYSDVTPIPTPASSDHTSDVQARYALTPDLSLFAGWTSRAKDRSFEAPYPNIDSLSNRYRVGIEGKIAGGQGGASFTGSTFNDHYGNQIDWTRNQVEVHYENQVRENLNLGGSWSNTDIKQAGYSDGHITVLDFNAAVDVNPNSTLGLDLKREDFSFPITQNGYIQKRVTLGAGYDTKLFGHRFSINYRHREEEQLNDDEDYVDVPVWNTVDGKLFGKIANIRYTLTGSYEHFSKGKVTLDDPFSLFWDDRLQGQLRLYGSRGAFDWYASEGFGMRNNSTRGAEIRSHEMLVGGSMPIRGATAFFEFFNQRYVVQGERDVDGYSLDEWFPTSYSLTAGCSKPLKGGSLDLIVNHTFTSYTNPMLLPYGNTRNTMFTARFQKRFAKDETLELSVSPWNFTDQLYSTNGYRATVFGVAYGMKF